MKSSEFETRVDKNFRLEAAKEGAETMYAKSKSNEHTLFHVSWIEMKSNQSMKELQ